MSIELFVRFLHLFKKSVDPINIISSPKPKAQVIISYQCVFGVCLSPTLSAYKLFTFLRCTPMSQYGRSTFFFEVYKVNSKITFFLNLNQPEKKLLFMWKHSLVGYFKVCSKLDSLRVDWGHNRQLCYC